MSGWPDDLQRELREFARERDWEKYHTPQNLAALIASEAGELLALFRWGQDSLAERPDLETAAREKIATNVRNYPADRSAVIDREDERS